MPRLYDYAEALILMKNKGLYAIAAPTGEKNEVFFIGQGGRLQVCKPTPSYPTVRFADAASYTLAQLENSGWMLPNYRDVGDKAFQDFSASLEVSVATIDGMLCEIERKASDCSLSELFKAAQESLDSIRVKIEEYRRGELDATKALKTEV